VEPDVTMVSTKGQVVIPASLRKRLGINSHSRLLVYGMKDTIILKKLTLPDVKKEMQSLWKEIDARTAKHGQVSEKEIQQEIKKYRSEKKGR
jgi:antitoxin PrlF